MTEEQIKILVLIHAVTGGISLLSGLIPMITKKGSKPHKIFGRVFIYSLSIATLLALFVSVQEGHENPFLFLIGILSLYFIMSGFRSLRFKSGSFNLTLDVILAFILLLSSFGMILYPIILIGKPHLLFSIFGVLGIIISTRDLLLYRDKIKLREEWLKMHLGNIMGAYISSVTAFVVVNEVLPSLISWIAPGILGGIYIAIWTKKVDRGTWAK